MINILMQFLITVAILTAFYGGFLLGRKKKETDKENLDKFNILVKSYTPIDHTIQFEMLKKLMEQHGLSIKDMTEKQPDIAMALFEDLKTYLTDQFDQFKPKSITEDDRKRNFYE